MELQSNLHQQIEFRVEKVTPSYTVCSVISSIVNGVLTFDTENNQYTCNLTSLNAHQTATFETIPALKEAFAYFIMTQMTGETVVPSLLTPLLE